MKLLATATQYIVATWMETERYDVTAKMPPGTTSAQRNAMIQNLLVERFQLQFHHESREMTEYDLVVAKGGPKMQPANANEKADPDARKMSFDSNRFPVLDPASPPRTMVTGLGGQTSIVTNKLSMGKLAEMLSSQLQTPVFDRTGLTEQYSFLLHFLPTRGPASMVFEGSSDAVTGVLDVAPTIFSALQSQLGLRLNRHSGPVDVLVVDKAQKTPIEN
jgi:uncharacterized protein (TIGR03435 family)